MKRSDLLRGHSLVIFAVLIGGAVLAHPPAAFPTAGTPSRTLKHGVHVKPPVTPKPRASVVPADPVPNTENPRPGPRSMAASAILAGRSRGNTSATFEGAVGAWGWDEDGSPATATGRTEAAHWVALNLKSPSRLTVRVSRKASAIDPLAIFPARPREETCAPPLPSIPDGIPMGATSPPSRTAGRWPGPRTFPTLTMPRPPASASKRPSPSPQASTPSRSAELQPPHPEPRQGYEATFASVSLEKTPKLVIRGGTKSSTTGRSVRIAGRAGRPGEVAELRLLHHGRTWTVKVRRGSWSTVVASLDPGINTVWISPVSRYGTVFPAQRITIRRN